jgi:hypothetical protein
MEARVVSTERYFPWKAIQIDDIRVYPSVIGVPLVLTALHDRAVTPILSHSIRVSFYNSVFLDLL